MNPIKAEVYYRVHETNWAAPLDEFDNPSGSGHTTIEVTEWPVHHHTPKGVILEAYSGARRIFINRSWAKQFAHPTKEEAIQAFLKRKKRQLSILVAQTSHTKRLIEMGQEMQHSSKDKVDSRDHFLFSSTDTV